jgi:hypothetical protein
MKIRGRLTHGQVELEQSINLPDGTEVEVIIEERKVFSRSDPIFRIMGTGHSGKRDISRNKYKYVSEAYETRSK